MPPGTDLGENATPLLLDITDAAAVALAVQTVRARLGTDRSLAGAPGKIVNIGSIGGKIAPPFLGPYAASKFALEGLSESLRRELMLYGINVIVIRPRAVATPTWGKAKQADTAAYQETDYAEPLRKYGQFMLRRQGVTTIAPVMRLPVGAERKCIPPVHRRDARTGTRPGPYDFLFTKSSIFSSSSPAFLLPAFWRMMYCWTAFARSPCCRYASP